MRANEAFPSQFLKSSDVKEKPRVAVISHVAQEKVGKGSDAEEKHVLHFEDCKPMVLNRTNWDALEKRSAIPTTGPDTKRKSNVPGHSIKGNLSTASASIRSSPSRRSKTT